MYTTGREAMKRPTLMLNSPDSHYTSPTLYSSSKTAYTLSNLSENGDQGSNQDVWAELGYEGSEHAIIWHIYNDEATKLDTATTDGLNRGIDVLLVFTGLFSAVLTTFIIQSYQQMLPGPSDETNALLIQLILAVRESSSPNGSSSSQVIIPLIPGEGSVPSTSEIHWVNGLWFAALSCSLSAALVSMLSKQWIQSIPNVSGSPRHRARQRQRRHIQMRHWRVSTVISALPLLLHIALLLFFAGVLVLLWSGEVAIMASTFAIVALSYIFYFGSMWMSFIYPDCPYQHPMSEHLRHWVSKKCVPRSLQDPETCSDERVQCMRRPITPPTIDPDHFIDSSSLVWLLEQCSTEDTIAATLQAIGGLPKDFTAFHVLREVGAVAMILQHFSKCFNRDVSFDLRWHVTDAQKAERYCRAWVRLTHGTAIMWPRTLQAPLEALKEYPDPHVSAIASCTIALISLESRMPQLSLIRQLESFVDGESKLSDLTQSWLLNTFLECTLSWELRAAVVSDITKQSVPVLLRVLQLTKTRVAVNHVHVTILLILSILVQGKAADGSMIWDAEKCSQTFRQTMIPVLTSIIQHPIQYGIHDSLLDFVIIEFSQLVTPFFTRASFSPEVKHAARQGLSRIYLQGRIANGLLPDSVLADILQILHPPNGVAQEQRPRFVEILLKTLVASADFNVQIGCIRLLEFTLKDCDTSVIRVFTEENGIATFLRLTTTAETYSWRLQTDCMRTLCIFINSTSTLYLSQQDLCPSHLPSIQLQFNEIFASDFFKILLFAVNSRQWWLAEIADIWLPSLLQLCRIRPQEQIWQKVETVFRDFAETHIGEEGSRHMLDDLNQMSKMWKLGTHSLP